MHLFVDGRMADTPHLHGIARYLYTIIEWGTRHRPQHKISVAARNPERWKALPVNVVKVRSKPFSLYEHLEFYRLLRKSNYDHVHFPSLAVPIWCPKRYSMTVHDLIPWHYPRSPLVRVYLTTVARWTVRQAHTVLSASRHTAKEMQKYLGFPADRVLVIYHGGLEGEPLAPEPAGRPYLLCVTNPKPHKNLHTLLEAFRGLEERCRLVVVCSDCPQLNPAPPGVERRSGLTDEEIRRLYANASVAVVPSFHEGFGLPALEAMLLGAPLISSHATSLPEVTGDAALLFDPHNADDLRAKLVQVLDNPQLASELRQRGLKRAQTFSWDKSARLHWDYFERTAAQPD
ncbi:MAG: glycosyltransferase family 4 protein [Candidatus Eremiobacteraeota bacterium]|nr:glycosyltransferase family 4 protein [Candidatus Eremiobacteraeota bacterium]